MNLWTFYILISSPKTIECRQQNQQYFDSYYLQKMHTNMTKYLKDTILDTLKPLSTHWVLFLKKLVIRHKNIICIKKIKMLLVRSWWGAQKSLLFLSWPTVLFSTLLRSGWINAALDHKENCTPAPHPGMFSRAWEASVINGRALFVFGGRSPWGFCPLWGRLLYTASFNKWLQSVSTTITEGTGCNSFCSVLS